MADDEISFTECETPADVLRLMPPGSCTPEMFIFIELMQFPVRVEIPTRNQAEAPLIMSATA